MIRATVASSSFASSNASMSSRLKVRGMDRARLTRIGAIVLAMAGLLLPAATFAKVRSGSGSSAASRSADPQAETGGHPIIAPGPFQLACSQNGTKVVEGQKLDHIAVPPSSLIGALSFRQAGEGGQVLILPMADGITTCVLSQHPEYLKRAAAAFERAIVSNRAATWALARAEASGRVVPLRSFADGAGQTCREFVQSITVAGRLETGTGVACRGRHGSWRLVQ
jgi:hypothetical protein